MTQDEFISKHLDLLVPLPEPDVKAIATNMGFNADSFVARVRQGLKEYRPSTGSGSRNDKDAYL